jgi:hypothetical protein
MRITMRNSDNDILEAVSENRPWFSHIVIETRLNLMEIRARRRHDEEQSET